MKYYHYTFSVTSAATSLSTLLSNTNDDQQVINISFQAAAANSNPVYIGGSNTTVSTTNFAIRIPVPVSSVPAGPFVIDAYRGGCLSLRDFKVVGTDGEKLQIGIVVMR